MQNRTSLRDYEYDSERAHTNMRCHRSLQQDRHRTSDDFIAKCFAGIYSAAATTDTAYENLVKKLSELHKGKKLWKCGM